MRRLTLLALIALGGCPPPADRDDASALDAGVDGARPDTAGADTAVADAAVNLDAAGSDRGAASGLLKGVVRDARNRPVGDAVVAVGALSDVTDYLGNYQIAGVPAGSATIDVSADWFEDRQQATTIVAGQDNSVDIALVAKALQVLAADRTLEQTYNATFDWSSDDLSIGYVPRPVRSEIDRALYDHNPALYRDMSAQAPITPDPLPAIGASATGFHFPLPGGSANAGQEAFDLATLVDNLAATPLTTQEQAASLFWEPAVEVYLANWDIAAASGLYYVGLAVSGQLWGSSASFPPQDIGHLFLHDGELWAEIVFADFVALGAGVSDDDQDGEREVYARIGASHFSAAVYHQLADVYAGTVFSPLDLRDNLALILDDLYSRSAPAVIGVIGVPYQASGVGTIQYPFVVLQHSGGQVNVLLVAPGT